MEEKEFIEIAKALLVSDKACAKQIWRRRIPNYPSSSIKNEINKTDLVSVMKLS